MSIYTEIGGKEAVEAAVEDFYRRVLDDPSLSGFFTEFDMDRLKWHQKMFIMMALGGPPAYTGRTMAAAHAGLGITSADFDSVVTHLAETLTGLGVPAETIGTIAGALLPLKADIVSPPAVVASG